MFKLLTSERLVPNLHLTRFEAPAVARKARPGQFVIIRVDETGERMPLTIADWDGEEGSVNVVFMTIGTSTRKLAARKAGDSVLNLCGPLGRPTEIGKFGNVVLLGGCYGIATIAPIADAMKQTGNSVTAIIEARSKNLLYGEKRLEEVCDRVVVTTGDGSRGVKGWAYDALRQMLEGGEKVHRVVVNGCTLLTMMASKTTQPFGVKTVVSLAPIMMDGTGMCGVCRVVVGGKTKFACVDGPDFDGHQVDWDLLAARRRTYIEEETRSLERWECLAAESEVEAVAQRVFK